MAITLGSVSFEDRDTEIEEHFEEVGGRDERRIVVCGVIEGESSVNAMETLLDAIVDAASTEDFSAALSIRSGRQLFVRRKKFMREIARDGLVASFRLELEAEDPFETSVSETTLNWTVTASGQTQAVTPGGNVYAIPVISLTATGDIIDPSIGDGVRSIAYSGTVQDGEELIFDAVEGTVTLEGVDVTPYTTGVFPRLAPEGTTLTYTDDAASSHTASVAISYHDRWW